MAEFDETIGGVNFMVVDEIALVVHGDSEERLDVDDVLKLAEFAAAAYEALAGGEYVHTEYHNGLSGVVKKGEHVIPKRYLDQSVALERDCE